jgi:flagellar biosynthesis/type III secretory pathway chaperone
MNADQDLEPEAEEKVLDPKKLARIEKEKKELLAALAGGNFSTQRTKVAAILNLFPDSRNSDIALALKYWEIFQPDIYNPTGIMPKDLFKLERLHYIVRARAKIQNEYGLFQADEKIKHHRKKQEEVMHEAVLEDAAPKRVVHVFSDETGKTHDFVVVAAVWVLSGIAVFKITQAIN